VSVNDLGKRLASPEFRRVPGMQIFVVRRPNPAHAVASILEQYRRVHVLGENVIILLLNPGWNRALEKIHKITLEKHEGGLWVVEASYGYMIDPDVPEIMRMAAQQSEGALAYDENDAFFVIAREVIVSCTFRQMPHWQSRLFSFMSRNMVVGPHYLHIPADRLILYNWLLNIPESAGRTNPESDDNA
jgi:K+ transporter